MKALFVRFRPWFENPRHPLQLALLAFLLTSPALTAGWIIDDYYHRAALQALPDLPELARSPAEMFAFVGDRWTMPSAALPWWSDAQLRLAFFRPVTGLTHWLDLRLWPDSAPLMHAQSLLWLALLVFLAARLYRQLSPLAPTVPLGVAGLAGLLFALDHGHAVPAAWIANRNALLAAAFSLAALTSYDRHRREAWAPGAWWTPLLLLAGVLSGEGAVGCGAYLLAYALLLDQGPLRSRLWALAPSTLVGVVWWLAYKWMGYGASHSTVYIDPGTQPDRFLGAMLERIPVLLWGQWSFPPADVYNALSQQAAAWALGVAVAFTVLLLWLLTPLLRESALARFYGAGMLLSMVPACATFPAMRLLVLPSFGAMGLMALFLCRTFGRRSRHVRREAAFFFLGVHIFFAPVLTLGTPSQIREFGALFTQSALSFPSDPGIEQQHVRVIHTPSYFLSGFAPLYLAHQGTPLPREVFVLASGIYETEVHRTDDRTLVVRPQGGFALPPGEAPEGESIAPVDRLYLLQLFDAMFRDRQRFLAGQRLEGPGVRIEVVEANEEGRPMAAAFRFDLPLEDPSNLWLTWDWRKAGFAPWQPPSVGETASLPGPFWSRPSKPVDSEELE